MTKSGTQQFRGSAAYFRRDDAFNSNSWERKRQCDAGQASSCDAPPYKYHNVTYTIGGPIVLPRFNDNRDKLFFFWSHDMLPRRDPGNLSQLTMPTELERRGDFSQTRDSQGRLIFIRDPSIANGTCNVTTGVGNACFPGNVIPASRISPYAALLLNPTLLPLPNTVDPTGRNQYNYTYQNELEKPRFDHVLRVDWNVASSTRFYSRFQLGRETLEQGYSSFLGSGANGGWPQFQTARWWQTKSMVNTLVHTFNPRTVLEVVYGVNWAAQRTLIVNDQGGLDSLGSLARNQRATAMPGLPTLFGGSGNPLDLIPNVTWAGTNARPGTPNYDFEARFPLTGHSDTHSISGNLTRVAGPHTTKAGASFELNNRPITRASSFNGTMNFNASAENPLDSNFGLANLLLGNLNAYVESDRKPDADGRFKQLEFFVQDTWRVRRNFTFDAGVRFYSIGPTYVDNQDITYFDPAAYDPGRAVRLYQAGCRNGAATCSGAQRAAVDPAGGFLPAFFIGKIIPGSGDLTNGLIQAKETPYKTVFRAAPRLGFAWDVTGDGKTAVRGGAGVYFDRYADDLVLALVEPYPLVDTRTLNFVSLVDLARADPVISLTSGLRGFQQEFTPPTVYNWSIGVQRDLPWGLLADVAYVGNIGRNNLATYDMNGLDYGTRRIDLNPSAADPTRNGTQAKDEFFFRPYVGSLAITEQQWRGRNSYHSIQVSVNRRLRNRFGWGLSYTGSTRESLTTFYQFLSDEENRQRNESRAGSRPHNLIVNYNYAIPKLSHVWDNALIRGIGDGWQVTGVSTFQSGTRSGFTFGFSPARADELTTGGPGGTRVTLVCDPNLPSGERTELRQFRTECVQMPGPTTAAAAHGGFLLDPTDMFYLGNAKGDEWLGLGFINHDLSVFKNFAIGTGRNLQVRAEFYNLFNSVQWQGVDTSATFNPDTGAQTDTNFGTVTGTRAGSARVIQFGVRFTF